MTFYATNQPINQLQITNISICRHG